MQTFSKNICFRCFRNACILILIFISTSYITVKDLAGVWQINYNKTWKNIFFTIYNVYTKVYCIAFIIFEFIFLFHVPKDDIRLFAKCLGWILSHLSASYKVIVWYRKRDIVLNIIEDLKQTKYHYESQNDFNPIDIMKKYDRLNYLTVSSHFWVGGLIPVTACMGTIFSIITNPDSVNGLDIDGNVIFCKNLPFTSWIPYHIDNGFKCGFASFLQANAILTFGYMIIGLDAAFTSMINYLTAHFMILQGAFKSIRTRVDMNICLEKENRYYAQKLNEIENSELKKCIEYLQTLFRLSKNLELTYKYQTLSQTMVALLVCSANLYLISTITFEDKSFFSEVSYMVAVTIALSLYCWFGNELTLSSMDIPQAIYESDWINLSENVKKSLLITMIRMRRPVILTVGMFSPLTLNTLVSIIRTSYSFFAVLQQVE